MMKILTPTFLSAALLFVAACSSYEIPELAEAQKIAEAKSLEAIADFKFTEESGIYIDEARGALAIDATKTSFRDVFIGASHSVAWLTAPQSYEAHLTVLSETDGESAYQLWVNDTKISEVKAPKSTIDYAPSKLFIGTISLAPEDMITVKMTAVTNGKIPEGDGTAFSRGRWTLLDLTPTP